MSEQHGRHSTAALLWAASSSAIAGVALGYALAQRRASPRLASKPVYGARLRGSPDTTPAATPRSGSRQDSALGSGLRVVLLVRQDVALCRADLAMQAARVVLGLFKKQYKRRDPSLRKWEESGYRMKVLGVDSENDILLQQAAARALTIPTHTFAGPDRVNKQRTVMAIGPAPSETLEHITSHLPQLPG